jgi:hypothetical protein
VSTADGRIIAIKKTFAFTWFNEAVPVLEINMKDSSIGDVTRSTSRARPKSRTKSRLAKENQLLGKDFEKFDALELALMQTA